MTRVGVFSDSHGDWEALDVLLEKMGSIDAVCFLGDIARDVDHLQMRLSRMPQHPALYAVRGNNDFACLLPLERVEVIGGMRVYMTHGHRFHGPMSLVYRARENDAQIALFGHTHMKLCEREQGVLLINPGSEGNACRGGRARACVLEIDAGDCRVIDVMA